MHWLRVSLHPDVAAEADPRASVLQHDFLCVSGMTFVWAVRTFEPDSLGELVEGLAGDDMTTGYHHGGVRVGGLLFRDGANENGVKVVRCWQRDFDL
jgi:hypothetical protein